MHLQGLLSELAAPGRVATHDARKACAVELP